VLIPSGLAVAGAVLADQAKSLDWRVRDTRRICVLPSPVVSEVLRRLATLLTR